MLVKQSQGIINITSLKMEQRKVPPKVTSKGIVIRKCTRMTLQELDALFRLALHLKNMSHRMLGD